MALAQITFVHESGESLTVYDVVHEEYDRATRTYRLATKDGTVYGVPDRALFYYQRKEIEDVSQEPAEEPPAGEQEVSIPPVNGALRDVSDVPFDSSLSDW